VTAGCWPTAVRSPAADGRVVFVSSHLMSEMKHTARLTMTIGEVDVKPVCNGTGAFLSQVILITGTGNLSF
jgi:hypothetical protein